MVKLVTSVGVWHCVTVTLWHWGVCCGGRHSHHTDHWWGRQVRGHWGTLGDTLGTGQTRPGDITACILIYSHQHHHYTTHRTSSLTSTYILQHQLVYGHQHITYILQHIYNIYIIYVQQYNIHINRHMDISIFTSTLNKGDNCSFIQMFLVYLMF